jgi:hypothetical protein
MDKRKPMNVFRNLKRANEWYSIKKGTTTIKSGYCTRRAFGAVKLWRQRMNGADIADVYYPALINGEESTEYCIAEKVQNH